MTRFLYYLVWLTCGTLYPAFSSYKAVRNKDAKLYVRWMMFWIVYAVFSAAESILDPFLYFWLPLYAEIKIVCLLYLVSSTTRGSTVIYKGCIHPSLLSYETEIDSVVQKLKVKTFQTLRDLITLGIQRIWRKVGNRDVEHVSGLVQRLHRSYSMVDLAQAEQKKIRRSSAIENISEEQEKWHFIDSRMKHYKSEDHLLHPLPTYSSLSRSPELMTRMSESTESLLPSFESDDGDALNEDEYRSAASDVSNNWEQRLEDMMKTLRKSKARLERNPNGTL